MFEIKAGIKNLDYDSVIEFGLPLLKANPPEKNGNFLVRTAVKNLIDSNSSTIKGILRLTPNLIKEHIANSIVNAANNNHTKIESSVQSLISKNKISLKICNIEINRLEAPNSFIIKGNIDSVDYISIIQKFLPMVKLDSSQNEMNKYLNILFSVLFLKLSDVENIINAIEPHEKESFIAFLAAKNNAKIIDMLIQLLKSKGILLAIDFLDIQAV